MKILIDIPEKVNEHIRAQVGHEYYPFIDTEESHLVGKAIFNGTPSNEWIPTKERLPAPNENDGIVNKYYLIQNVYGDMMVAHYDGKGWKQMYHRKYLEDKVVAWMELPKRYIND